MKFMKIIKKKYVCLVITSIVFYISCSTHSNPTMGSKENSLYVLHQENVKNNHDESLLYSSLYKGIKTILLETNETCLIGVISKMRVDDHYIFILDRHIAKSLYMFDKEGHFIRKIGEAGNGPGEYILPFDFAIDSDSKTIYILDMNLQRVNKYDITTGTFIHAINLDQSVSSRSIEYIDGKLYADAFFREHSDDNYLLRIIQESSGKEEGHYLNVMEYHKGISNTNASFQEEAFFLREDGNIVFVQPFMDHIIEITRDSIFSLVNLEGKETLASEDIKSVIEKKTFAYLPELTRFNKYVNIVSFHEQKNWIFLEYMKGYRPTTILIDKQINEVHIFEKRSDDLLVIERGNFSIPVPKVGCYDANGVYRHIAPESISNIKELAKAGALSPDLDRLEDLKNLEIDGNPILFYYEFKE